jgi:2-hydroxy-3-keto-5-methylthiopentenyl-1-phosphate phosphatase
MDSYKNIDDLFSSLETRVIVLCDFDGTLTDSDLFEDFLLRYGGEGVKELVNIFRAKRISSGELVRRGFRLLSGREAVLEDYLNSIMIYPSFHDFLSYCRDSGFDLCIVSDAIDTFINPVLRSNGFDDLYVISNHLAKNRRGVQLITPWRDKNCPICRGVFGVCKRNVGLRFKQMGRKTIVIGDGMTDRCAITAADIIFAKEELQDICRQDGFPFFSFRDFSDIQFTLKHLKFSNID